jgi:hypothetical protein
MMCLNETYSKDSFPIQNGIKQGDVFQLCFRICHYECAGKSCGTEIEWGTSGYADDVNLLGDNIDAIEKTQKL